MNETGLCKIVDEILQEISSTESIREILHGESINWLGLSCMMSKQFQDGSWYVMIEEADPDCPKLSEIIQERLYDRAIQAVIHTQW